MASNPLTPAQIAAIREREAKATEGPWHWHSCGEKCYSFVLGAGVSMTEGETLPPGRIETERYNEAKECYEQLAFINDYVAESGQQSGDIDFDFIAHARTDIPALLAMIDRLTADRDRLARENADLRAVVERLQAQASGRFWRCGKCGCIMHSHNAVHPCKCGERHYWSESTYDAWEVFTRAAAEAARTEARNAKPE